MNSVPELEHLCGSWVVTRVNDGSVVGEFYERSIVTCFNPALCQVETALQYLARINQKLKEESQ